MGHWIYCRNRQETESKVRDLARLLKDGDVLSLEGDLGAGKTQFSQWIAEEWGVKEAVTSPTFSLVHSYQGREGQRIHHLDLYRLEVEEEIEELDLDTLFYPEEAFTLIEWAERAPSYLPKGLLRLRIQRGEGEERRLQWLSTGPRSEEIRKDWGVEG